MEEINHAGLVDRAEKNLQRQIEWVSRAETRTSLILGITVGMLGYSTSLMPAQSQWSCLLAVTFLGASALQICCLFFLFKTQFPQVLAPKPSLVFFGEITKLSLDDFREQSKIQNDEGYLDDLLAQIHRNSEIVTGKFRYLSYAMKCLLIGAVLWFPAIYLAQTLNRAVSTTPVS